MRGQMSRHRCHSAPRARAGTKGEGARLAVKSDIGPNFPIADEELAVIEAFLLPAILALAADAKGPQTSDTDHEYRLSESVP